MNDLSPKDLTRHSQKRAVNPEASVWVPASAGTGKTKVLAERVLALLLTGTMPQRILCLTYTNAAAAEMANRISGILGTWTTLGDADLTDQLIGILDQPPDQKLLATARQLFARVLDVPGGMKIQTIHAFCQSLLRRFPVEAGIAPQFDLLDEHGAIEIILQARDLIISRAATGEDLEMANAMGLISVHLHESRLNNLLDDVIFNRDRLKESLDAHEGVRGMIDAVMIHLNLGHKETETSIIEGACSDNSLNRDGIRNAVEVLLGGGNTDQGRGHVIKEWIESPALRASTFDKYKSQFLTKDDKKRKTLITKKASVADQGVEDVLDQEALRLENIVNHLKTLRTANLTAALIRFGAAILDQYTYLKQNRALLDYDDLIEHTKSLLSRSSLADWVLYKLDGGLDHILIDEAQDTNPRQWEIIAALTADFFSGSGRYEDTHNTVRTVFAVGDPKQSIFSFQGADPTGFTKISRYFHRQLVGIGRTLEEVELTVSFRSAPAVLAAVDSVFALNSAKGGVVPEGHTLTHQSAREGAAGMVEVWEPVPPPAKRESPPWKPPVEQINAEDQETKLARLIAKRIHRMTTSGEKLESKGRNIEPGDIMVLVRRRTRFFEELVRALKVNQIPVTGVDRMELSDQLAVMDLVALGRFLLLPDDDLSLATVLKSPIIGFTENQLFDLAYGRNDRSLWSVLQDHANLENEFSKGHKLLADLLSLVDFMTPYELYSHILVELDGRRKLLKRLGLEAEDPIDEFLSQTLKFEKDHVPSLELFLHWLEHGNIVIKRDLEQTEDAVRIMTVHGAKGLQAPIIFLPDTLSVPTTKNEKGLFWDNGQNGQLMLWVPKVTDADIRTKQLIEQTIENRQNEHRRLLYVAMTRAEDRLYVCGWKNKNNAPDGCWYNLIRNALENHPSTLTQVDGFLSDDKTLDSAEVLRLSSPQHGRPEQRETSRPRGTKAETLPHWMIRPPPSDTTEPRPLAPSQASEQSSRIISLHGDDSLQRHQRGLLIHKLLQILPNLPQEDQKCEAESIVSRRQWALDQKSQKAIVKEALAVLENKECMPFFSPSSDAEVPIIGMVNGYEIYGQVDRLLVTNSVVNIIDYKTDRQIPSNLDEVPNEYLLQMAVYREALKHIYTNKKIVCSLLWTNGPTIMILDSNQLDAAAKRL